MNKHFKYSILITITLLITISLVYAQPVPIGQAKQTRPYESNPTVATPTSITTTWGAERDGDLATSVAFQGDAAAPVGYVILDGFDYLTPPDDFTIGWVDIKIKYKHPGLGDDAYSIAYNTDGSATFTLWLQMSVSGAAAKFDRDGVPQVRPWSDLTTTSGLAWTWTDVENFRVRIMVVRGADALWSSLFELYEVWLTIYESAPEASSTALSVMPPGQLTTHILYTGQNGILGLLPGEFFFVDVYANGLPGSPGLWGYQTTIKYDESIVTATEFFTYWPFIGAAPSEIQPGYVSVSYFTFAGDTVGFTGVSTPLCRIYFQVDSGGATELDLLDDRPTYITELKPVGVEAYVPPLYDSWFAGGQYLSAHTSSPTLIDLADPLDTLWHELYPNYCKEWVLTSWEDNPDGIPDGILSECDQIDMTNETGWIYWFHVDAVTITIHWTFKEGPGGPTTGEIGAAEPEIPMLEMPSGSPIGSRWHMIYPDYCRTIEITSWEDTDLNGEFNPSDQFDFTYLPFDVVLAGTAPPAGASLSTPAGMGLILYDDADLSGTWSVGEGAWDDLDYDYMYMPPAAGGIDVWLVGTEPDWFDFGSPPGPTNKYYDANTNGLWDVGEPAIDDLDLSGTYDPQVELWAHLDGVSTDILVSQKPIDPYIIPEFPLGIGFIMALAPIIPLIYMWRRKGWKK